MKFLLDCHAEQVLQAMAQWPDVVLGQLLTPLTKYRRAEGGAVRY